MALLVGLIPLVVCVLPSTADFTLSFQHDVTGTWKRSVILPCTYAPQNYVQHTVTWLYRGERIFERDDAGDHTLRTKYRGRLSLPQDRQGGDVSLTIMELQTDDKGEYTCQVSLIPDGATNRTTKQAAIDLAVEKVRVTKPIIQPGGLFLEVPPESTINLTCSADGSPPITYRWYKQESSSSVGVFQLEGAFFIIKKAAPSHSGIYICEAENRALGRFTQQSEGLRLGVSDQAPKRTLHTTRIPIIASVKSPGTRDSSTAEMSTAIFSADLKPSSCVPPWLILLVVLLSLALICTLIAVLVTRSKKRKGTDSIYEMPIMSELYASANQDPSAAPIYRVTTCQANGSQANIPWTNDTAVPRKENQYEPQMAEEAEPQSHYQNALLKHESEYEELLVEKGRVQQS